MNEESFKEDPELAFQSTGTRSTGDPGDPGDPGTAGSWGASTNGDMAGKLVGHDHVAELPHAHGAKENFHELDDAALYKRLSPRFQKELDEYRRDLADNAPAQGHYLCWTPSTPPEVAEAFRRVEMQTGMSGGETRTMAFQFLGSGHWAQTATDGAGVEARGRPVTVTWSIVRDGTSSPSRFQGGDSAKSNFRARMAALYGGKVTGPAASQPWFGLLAEAINAMGAQSGVRLVYEPADDGVAISTTGAGNIGILGVRGDIRISGRQVDGNDGVLAYAYSPDFGGDIVMDTGDRFFRDKSNDSIGLVNTIAHEIGHSLGLDHVCPITETKLMEPFISNAFRGPQFDEKQSLQAQYGDASEAISPARNNDSADNATPLGLVNRVTTVLDSRSIDRASDIDYYSFVASPLHRITVRVSPPEVDEYLEGPQLSDDSCDLGDPFDPAFVKNLGFSLVGPDGTTELVAENSEFAGGTEQLSKFRIPSDGTFFIRVAGNAVDRAQLYRLEVLMVEEPPGPSLDVDRAVLLASSNSGANGAPDPGETVRYQLTLTNRGELPGEDLMATVASVGGTVSLGTAQNIGDLAVNESTTATFTFAPGGEAGQLFPVTLNVTGTGYSGDSQFEILLSKPGPGFALNETFDASSAAPSGWISSTSKKARPWAIATKRADSKGNSYFAPGSKTGGESRLTSPEMTIGETGGTLKFRHHFNHEKAWDGAVLEASRNGDPWFDLINSTAATVVEGGYNQQMRLLNTPLSERRAWSGKSKAFVTTQVRLPVTWAGDIIRFRWRVIYDRTVAGEGWYLDNVSLATHVPTAEPFRPVVSLATSGTALTEGAEPVQLTLSTPLPLARDVSVPLVQGGSASASDISGTLVLILPQGQTQAVFDLGAVEDGLAEGTETLALSIPASDPGFKAGTSSIVNLTIADQIAPVAATKGSMVQTVNSASEIRIASASAASTTPPASFDLWMASHAGLASSGTGPTDDLDGDGWQNLAEYVLHTDPSDASEKPQISTALDPDTLSIVLEPVPARPDASVSAETSTDTSDWTDDEVQQTPGKFSVPRTGAARFLRLKFSFNPEPPTL